jgi:ribosomal protein S18 acetylase RimI-like enzyme
MAILRYKPEHQDALISSIGEDPDWKAFVSQRSVDKYKKSLRESLTYVCYEKGVFVGYLRALHDDDFSIYISELFVVPEWRNRTIGRTLLAQVKKEFPDLNIYVLSDEDAYYEKLGYGKVGSVFEVPE